MTTVVSATTFPTPHIFRNITVHQGNLSVGMWDRSLANSYRSSPEFANIVEQATKRLTGCTQQTIVPRLSHGSAISYAANDFFGKNHGNTPVLTPQEAYDGYFLSSEYPLATLCMPPADCPIVLLYGMDVHDRMWYGFVHCGWRSLAGGILEKAFDFLESKKVYPYTIGTMTFPHIRSCCFLVDQDVLDAFKERYNLFTSYAFQKTYDANGNLKYRGDMLSIIRAIISLRAPCTSFYAEEACTYCANDHTAYHSARRALHENNDRNQRNLLIVHYSRNGK